MTRFSPTARRSRAPCESHEGLPLGNAARPSRTTSSLPEDSHIFLSQRLAKELNGSAPGQLAGRRSASLACWLPDCLPACLPARLPARLLVCRPSCLPACLPTSLVRWPAERSASRPCPGPVQEPRQPPGALRGHRGGASAGCVAGGSSSLLPGWLCQACKQRVPSISRRSSSRPAASSTTWRPTPILCLCWLAAGACG